MRIQKVNLFLKLVGIRPVIISIQESNVLPFSRMNGRHKVHFSRDASMLFFMENKLDLFRVFILVLQEYFPCVVSRDIIANNDLILEVGFLHQNPVKRLPDIGCVIIGDDRNAHQRM